MDELSPNKRRLVIALVLFCLYVGTYVEFRRTHIQVSEKDGRWYVIYPGNRAFLFYVFIPLEFVDSAVTDMKFLIAP